jgi:lipopolysaccharide transport system permease protein
MDASLPTVIYTPASPLRHPGRLFKEMFRDLVASRELAWRLFIRDTSAQYRQSILGYVWAFVPPLMASLPFVFLNSQGVVGIKGTSIPYAAYAMIGTIIWQAFADALNSPLKTVTAAKTMLAKINFPREAILLSGLGQVLFGVLIRLVLLVAVFVWFRIPPPPTACLFPLGILALVMVGFMIGIVFTPFGLLYTDVQQTLPVLSMFLMFLTPVLYPPPQSGLAAAVARWNPLSPLVVVTRNWLTTGAMTGVAQFAVISAVALVLLLAGWLAYRLALPHIIARIGN